MVLTAAISALHQNIYTTKHTLITCTIMTIMILTVSLRYYSLEGLAFDREVGEVTIPMIAFIEGGMTLPICRITRDYLRNHRLCPQQCTPNFFRILGAIDTLDRHLGLGLT